VHIHSVDTELVGTESKTLENLVESESLSVSNADELVRRALHLGLDESKQMLLVHRRRVVNVSIDLKRKPTKNQYERTTEVKKMVTDLSNVVEITARAKAREKVSLLLLVIEKSENGDNRDGTNR